MKTVKIILLTSLAAILFGCGASQKIKEPNAELDQLMTQQTFEIKIRTAEPLVTQALAQVANSGMLPPGNTISRIDVNGSGFFIKVEGDSVSANLPYYGEQQMGGGYNANTGIKFDGLSKNMQIVKDETKQGYLVKFSIDSSAEVFGVTVAVNNNLSSSTSINSSHRNRIRYTGTIISPEQSLLNSAK
ncbi:MAG: DUF4251 domain-containing protein [Maribacter sp.]